jgi:hypothetical protein
LNRLASRENLFFRPDTKLHRKRSKAAKKAHERKRKPGSLKADALEFAVAASAGDSLRMGTASVPTVTGTHCLPLSTQTRESAIPVRGRALPRAGLD